MLHRATILTFSMGFTLVSSGCTDSNDAMSPTSPGEDSVSIISLHPSITETMFHLGAEGFLVGRSDYCAFPSKSLELSPFGTAITPNFESIAQAKPTYILGDMSLAQHKDNLDKLGTVSILPWLSMEDMKRSIQQLGELTNTESTANQTVEDLQSHLKRTPNPEAPSVLLLLGGSDIDKGQLWFIKPESVHGEMLKASGYHNAIDAGHNVPQMGIEELLALNPPVIALFGDAKEPLKDLEQKKVQIQNIADLKAVQDGHVCVVTLPNAFGTGPSILETIPLLEKQLKTCLQ